MASILQPTPPYPHGLNIIADKSTPNPQIDGTDPTSPRSPPHEKSASTHPNAHIQPTRDNPPTTTPNTLPTTKPIYTHQSLKALTLNTRGMHITIVDLQNILTNQPNLHIIALTETKHRHIKSSWRQALRNYKLVYNSSLYDKHTKRCSSGTILAIHKNAYSIIKTLHIPPTYQPYLAIAPLTPKAGSEILAIAAYLPQHHTSLEDETYQNIIHLLHTLLTTEHPNTPTLLGGEL
jgi:hypothetical protein